MEELSRRLDRQFIDIKDWRHLAHVLNVPPYVSRQIEMFYTGLSPTVRLFQYLQDVHPDLTVRDLKTVLKKIDRDDIVEILNDNYKDEDFVASKVTDKPEMLDEIALELDTGKRLIGNWKSLSAKLGLTMNRVNQFEMYSNQNPTAMLFVYLSMIHPSLKVETLKKHLSSMKRNDFQEVLKKRELRDEDLVRMKVVPDSDVSIEVENLLNRPIVGAENWKKLAFKLGVPWSVYYVWDPDLDTALHSPTKLLLEWLCTYKPDLKIDDFVGALQKIERNDAVEILMKFFPNVLSQFENKINTEPAKPERDNTDGNTDGRGVVLGDLEGASPLCSSAAPRQESVTQDTPLSTVTPGTPKERRAMSVPLIPLQLYRTVCMRLDIRRLFYDDFRMVGEKCGIDRGTINYLEQRSEPTREIIQEWTGQLGDRANVGAFIDILKEIARNDVAEILEKWVETGD